MAVNVSVQVKRINEIKEKWYLLEPLYFMIFTTHNTLINSTIKTIRSGKGKIEFNPEFTTKLSNDALEVVLKCELLRIMLKHPYTRRREIASISYQASNITIKEYIEEAFFPSAQDVFRTREYNRKHFELYYEKLIEMSAETTSDEMQSTENGQANASQSNNSEAESQTESPTDNEEAKSADTLGKDEGHGNNSENKSDTENSDETRTPENEAAGSLGNEPTDGPQTDENTLEQYAAPQSTGRENAENWDENELMQNIVNDKIHDAEQRNSWGSVSGSMREQIIASCNPKADYRSILKAFRASILSQQRTLTRMKPSRRYGFRYMGSRRDFCTKLLFAVDVSGSVSGRDLQNGFSVINRLFKYGIEAIDVIQFDTEIKGEAMTMKKALKTVDVLGRGGTSFQAVIDYIDENRQYDGLIVFTDGYAPAPVKATNRRTKILWLFNNEENHNYMAKVLGSIGRCAFIKS